METHKLLQQYTVHERFFETATCANGCDLLVPTVVLLGTCEPIIKGNHSNAQTEANLKCCTQDEASKTIRTGVRYAVLEEHLA
jgi:hypothetical protein